MKARTIVSFGVKQKTGNLRLTHNIYVTRNDIERYSKADQDHDRLKAGETKLSSCIPLIEMKSHFRLKIENHLHIFYKEIIQALKTQSMNEVVVAYSPCNFSIPAKVDPDQNREPPLPF